ncbi:MAG: hypothetical protein JWM73_2142 [Solirubrobacterales bacterium]|nr:hypothetical protein [Solirubrobacterales bacterium]
MVRRLSPLLLALALIAGLGGCADGKVKEANAYVGAVNDAQTRFAATSEKLLGEITHDDQSPKARVALGEFYGAVDTLVGELRAIAPPAKVKSLHDRLIASMVRFGDQLRSAGDDLGSNNAGRILNGQQELASASASVARSINATIKAINDSLTG